jgi:outer membrane lipoprotein-sorting protein/peroxiredoxin
MKLTTLPLAAAAALSLALTAPNANAQATDPTLDKLFADVAAAYRGLTTFSADILVVQKAGPTEHKRATKLTIQKPAKLSAEINIDDSVVHVVSNGTSVFTDSSKDTKSYVKQPVAKFDDAVSALARNGGAGIGLLPILLTNPAAEKQIVPGKPTSLKRLPDEMVSGEPCDVVEAILGEGERSSKFNYAIGKTDHLIRRLSIGPAKEEKPSVVETYSNISLQPSVTDATFAYTPAPGAEVKTAPAEPQMFDPRLKVGAVPLAISGNDLAGKPVTLAEYKGKVLLLDFWATWCGPCVGELPNVVAAYNKYHAKGFEIVGISLDQADAKPKLTKFIADKKMPWRQIYDGKFWEAGNAKAYGVQSIPFTLLIGKDGKIAAVGARGEALAPAIEAALKK